MPKARITVTSGFGARILLDLRGGAIQPRLGGPVLASGTMSASEQARNCASQVENGSVAAPGESLGRILARGYDWRSAAALGLVLVTGGSVGYRWSDLLDANAQMDWLLTGIWIWLAAMICWRVRGRRDLLMIVVGIGGGGTIEWWGTNTELWRYFTNERPPLWILPAWPAATIAIDRMGMLVDELVQYRERTVGRQLPVRFLKAMYFIVVPAFVAWMTLFLWPTSHLLASDIVIGLMVLVASFTLDARRDMALFAAGTLMGVFLEYWGTSRYCWTYYTEQVPPPVAVVAHGFAAIAFTRCADAVQWLLDRSLDLAGYGSRPATE